MNKQTQNSPITGGLKELTRLFFPLALMTFSNCLFIFTEKILLGRLSTEAMEAAVNVAYTCLIFQGPTVALAMMAQVFVGRWQGAQEVKLIGPGIWQYIWFSILSLLITVPGSLIYGHYYFQGTAIESIALPYFYFLISINFLYPLSTTLTCFFLGRGKTNLVLWATLSSQLAKLILAYVLIFGLNDWVPALGLMGGAFSTAIAQGGFCLLLFLVFLHSKNAVKYCTRQWGLKLKFFWECINPGLLRASNRILNFTSWASIAHLMAIRGGDYLLILSIGGTLNLFLPFLGEAICQGQTTVVSQILGAKNYFLLNKAFKSGSILSLIAIAVLSIPLLVFPSFTFHSLFPTIALDAITIQRVLFGLWVSIAFFTFGYIPISYILAFKDTKFSLFMGGMNWLNGFLLMYIAINKVGIAADQFWLTLSLMHATTTIMYLWRMRVLQSRVMETPATA